MMVPHSIAYSMAEGFSRSWAMAPYCWECLLVVWSQATSNS